MTSKDILRERFAERLRILMDEFDETTYSLGELLGMDHSSISKYLTQTHKPKQPTIKFLAEYFSVDPAWLMGYDVDKQLKNINIRLTEEEYGLIKKHRRLTERQKIKLEGVIDSYMSEAKEDKKRDVS